MTEDRTTTKAKLYARIDPLFNWIHGVLYEIRARAVSVSPTRFHDIECVYGGLTQKQKNALQDLVGGYGDGFDSFVTGVPGVIWDSTDEQVAVLLKIVRAFVEGFGGTWESGEAYQVDAEGVRIG